MEIFQTALHRQGSRLSGRQDASKYDTMALCEQIETIGDAIHAVLGPLRGKTIFFRPYPRMEWVGGFPTSVYLYLSGYIFLICQPPAAGWEDSTQHFGWLVYILFQQ